MDSASVGSEVKPKVRVVTITVVMRFVVISIIVTPLPRVVTMVFVQPIVPLTIFVVVSVNRAIVATSCLRWRRPSNEKYFIFGALVFSFLNDCRRILSK